MTDDEHPTAVPPLHVRVMGVRVAIVAPDLTVRDRLAFQWSRAVVAPVPQPDAVVEWWAGGSDSAQDYSLTARVTYAALEFTTGSRINLHAGGVADEEGRLLALVAPSGTGKTTATLTLARRLGYVTDETVSIAPDGTVAPHPKPLSVIVDADRPFDKHQYSPDELGLLPTPDGARLTRLVVLRRGGDGRRGLTHLSRPQAILQLVEQSSSVSRVPHPLRTLLALVDACQGVWELGYDEITDHVDALVDLLAAHPSEPLPEQQLTWHEGEHEARLEFFKSGPLLARFPWVEAVEIDEDLVVLTHFKAWLLSGLMATIWLALDRPRTIEELIGRTQDVHGAHDEAEARVREAVSTLYELQLACYGVLAESDE